MNLFIQIKILKSAVGRIRKIKTSAVREAAECGIHAMVIATAQEMSPVDAEKINELVVVS